MMVLFFEVKKEIPVQMHRPKSIRRVDQIFVERSIDLPERAGVYAFWWVGPRADFMAANRHIVLKGPGERPVDVEYRDWWPEELVYPCLYEGKTTNVRLWRISNSPESCTNHA